MSRSLVIATAALILWILWCVFAIAEIVPALRLHVSMWPGFLAYVLCMAPILIAAFLVILGLNRQRRS